MRLGSKKLEEVTKRKPEWKEKVSVLWTYRNYRNGLNKKKSRARIDGLMSRKNASIDRNVRM